MSKADPLKNKIDGILKRIGPNLCKVLVRRLTVTGGDPLTGHGQTVTSTDEELNPQPRYRELTESIELSNGVKIYAGDYTFTISAHSLSLEDLKDPKLQIVLKDSSGSEEVYRIFYYRAPQLYGEALMFRAYGRKVRRS